MDIPETKVLVTVDLAGMDRDLPHAANVLGVPVEDIDASFGLIPVEIGGTVCAVLVESKHIKLPRTGVEGPFANPRVEAIG